MSFVANHMVLETKPKLKSWHVVWEPSAVRGARRIEEARFRGFNVTGTATAYLERRAAEEGRERTTAVETSVVLHIGRGGGREGTVTGVKGNEVHGRLRGTRVAERVTKGNESVAGASRLGTLGGERDRGSRARRGTHPDNARNNHTGGHTALARGTDQAD